MRRSLAVVFSIFCVGAKMPAQMSLKNSLVFDLTLGLNSPYKNANTGSKTFTVYNEFSQPITLQERVSSSLLLPPISFGADIMLGNKIGLSMNAMYQSHVENWSITEVLTNEMLRYWTQKHRVTTLTFGVKGIWLLRENYHMGSGLGFGGSQLSVSGEYPKSIEAWAIDVRFLFIRYEICCNWFLNFHARATQALSNFQQVVGYNIGFGLSHVFNTH